ncbi:MAG: tetratricopeptide repeat protein [bacterium]
MQKRKCQAKRSSSFLLLCSFLSVLPLLWSLINSTTPAAGAAVHEPKKPSYNLLLITIDTLRADHLGCYGYQDVNTPAIDALASEGILFTQAITPVPITLPSHVSIMTGLYPLQHGVMNNGTFILGEKITTLAEVMKSKGYLTGACVGAYVLDSIFGLDQGFDLYDDSLPRKNRVAGPLDSERRAEEVTQSALRWLKGNHNHSFFLWVHYFDPHALYLPPSPFKEEYKQRLYDGEIAYTDKCIGDLFHGLKEMGVSDKTLIILTADHGEGLYEHNEPTHTIFIYDSTLHVPLIMSAPSGLIPSQKAKTKITSMVTTLDIFPTIMDLFSLQPGAVPIDQLPGKSLVPLLGGESQPLHQEIFCQTLYPELNFGWSKIEGIRTSDWKYVKAPRSELYHLSEDPLEKKNLLSDQPQLALEWEKKLSGLEEKLQKGKKESGMIKDEAVLRRLESLGYLRMVQKDTEAVKKRPDPKDMVQLIERIDRGLSYYYLGSYELAESEFEKILEASPENVSAFFYLGCIQEKMRKFEQAHKSFLRVLSLQPGYMDARNHLGVVYHEMGKFEDAVKEFKIALKEAEYIDVYYNLGTTYKEMGLIDEAISSARSAIEIDPNHSDALNLLGEIALEKGDMEEASADFQKVLQITPEHLEAHNNLGVVYFRKAMLDEALREFLHSVEIDPNRPETLNNIGSLYLAQGSYDKAEDAFKKALAIRPAYSEAFVNLGTIYFKEGELAKAKEQYQQATRLFPDNQDAWNYLGLTCFTLGEYEAAVAPFESALKTGQARADIYLSLGKTYSNLRSFEKSLFNLKKSVEIDPDNLEAHQLMGHILYDELGRAQEAIKEWEESHRLAPRDTTPLMNLAAVHFQASEYPQAISLWREVIEIDPNAQEPYLHIGTAYLKQENIEEAIRSWQKILDKAPSHSEALINMGTAYYRQGDLEKAKEAWQKAKKISPENTKIHYNLALALMYQRNYRESLEELSEIIRLEPDNTQARALMDVIRQQESYQHSGLTTF